MSIENKIALITGAGRGVGRATALRFARAGARVVLFGRTAAYLETLHAEIVASGGQALAVAGDVSQEQDVLSLFDQIRQQYGRLDILINSAAIVAKSPFVDMPTDVWDQVINTNLRGTFLCCREAFRMMIPQDGGVIVNISSLSGVKGVEKFPGMSAYNVSKSGVAGLTEILAVEGKPHHIRVCAVSPGAIDTDMLRQAAPHLKAGMTAPEFADLLFLFADDTGNMLNGSNIELFTNA